MPTGSSISDNFWGIKDQGPAARKSEIQELANPPTEQFHYRSSGQSAQPPYVLSGAEIWQQ
ncbi:hypothetical protein VTN00DRAFT_1628 [Thermoascus crustaceus]|uniref:uncharacterized protein n=1 Tax=Thermoascus crustaceus TaxID=5088 RepID=UPI0037431C84